MGRSAHASPPRVLAPPSQSKARRRESDALLRDREYATFCSISLASEPRGSKSAIEEAVRLQQQYLHGAQELPTLMHKLRRGRKDDSGASDPSSSSASRSTCGLTSLLASVGAVCAVLARLRPFAVACVALFLGGITGVAVAIVSTADADWYLFVGALVSCAFSLVVTVSYAQSRSVRAHPNPLILSKSLVDLLLGAVYVFEYCATEYAHPPLVLPVRMAAVTQALLVCGEFWFFAMPIDMVQSITNPFTSYAHNNRVYWFYSTLSGLVCGIALWLLDDTPTRACVARGDCSDTENRHLQRFFWFHENTDAHGFWWHHWLSYHLWVLVYLVFATASVVYVKRRLRRGLEETFDVRRRVLSSGLLTCWIYISWSLAILALFVATNLPIVKITLRAAPYEDLVNVGAFLHSARGGLNIIVWLVINSTSLRVLCLYPAVHGTSSNTSVTATGSSSFTLARFPSAFGTMDGSAASMDSAAREEQEVLLKPELNAALRRQMIQMATSGIVESVEHYHRLHRRIASNQTFDLDWQSSPHRDKRQLSASMSLARVAATRNATIRVVEADDAGAATATRFTFLPMAMKEMQFYDFQPRLFATVRQLYGIDDAEYIYGFRHTMNERISEGRSGAFVFTTSDRRYLVKSTTATEKDVLLGLLPSYLRYLKWNPRTLLPRFFGFHAMKMYGQVFYFVVMGNVLNTAEVIHRRYDIKGSWVDRNAPACVLGDQYRCSKCNRFFAFGVTGPTAVPCEPTGSEHYPDITLRDNDLKKRLKLEPDAAAQLVKQLTRDSNFLASMGIMDYSLLIGTHYSHFTIASATSPKKVTSGSGGGFSTLPQHQDTGSSASAASAVARDGVSPGEGGGEYVHVLCDDKRDERDGDEDVHNLVTPHSEPEPTASVISVSASASASASLSASVSDVDGGVRQLHRYRAHQVAGPSMYYFGLVDVLQKWNLSKQVERMYKVHMLRKSPRGVSAIAPKAYALRFQQKMRQLLVTTPPSAFTRRSSIEPLGDRVDADLEVGGAKDTEGNARLSWQM